MRRMFSLKQLQEIADSEVQSLVEGGALNNAKPIYWHTIRFQRGGAEGAEDVSRVYGDMIILNNSATPITANAFVELLKTEGFVGIVFNGKYANTVGTNLDEMYNPLVSISYLSATQFSASFRDATTNALSTTNLGVNKFVVQDLGINKIN